ncbi:MAG: hypothetical protein AAGF77_05560 [Bacteroidota bacterium]
MNNKKKIADFFKEQLEQGSPEPTDSVWVKIQETLRRKKKKRVLWLRFLMGALFLMLPIVVLFTETKPPLKSNLKIEKVTNRYKNQNSSPTHTTDVKRIDTRSEQNRIEEKSAIAGKKAVLPSNSFFQKGKQSLLSSTKQTDNTQKQHLPAFYGKRDTVLQISEKESIANDHIHIKSVIEDDTILKRHLDTTTIASNKKVNPKKVDKQIKRDTTFIKKKEDTAKGFNISIQAAPTFSGYLNSQGLLLPNNVPKSNTIGTSFSYRILFNIPTSSNTEIRFGIGQQEFSFKSSYNLGSAIEGTYLGLISSQLSNPLVNLPDNLQNDVNQGVDATLENEIRYIQLPLEAVYYLKKEKLSMVLIGGIDFFMLQRNKVLLSTPSLSNFYVGEVNYLSRLTIASHIGFGLKYPISKAISLEIEPTMIYQMGGYRGGAAHPHPIYFSVFSGIRVQL